MYFIHENMRDPRQLWTLGHQAKKEACGAEEKGRVSTILGLYTRTSYRQLSCRPGLINLMKSDITQARPYRGECGNPLLNPRVGPTH
jgi:hypothetical protein